MIMRLFQVMVAVLAASPSSAFEQRYPLKVAEGQRILLDQEGAPFLVVGDTAWSLIVQLHEADIDQYLDDRRSRGFNAIIVNLIEHKFCTDPPRTRAGLAPFKKDGDLSVRNPRTLISPTGSSRRHAIADALAVWLTPAYLGAGGGDEGWFRDIKAGGLCNAESLWQIRGEAVRGPAQHRLADRGRFRPRKTTCGRSPSLPKAFARSIVLT